MSPGKLEILAYEETSLGPLCLRRRELLSEPGTIVTEVTLNHEFLMSSYNTDSERIISNRAVQIHGGSNLDALVGGFGLGYTARELLVDINVASVQVVEFLPPVIEWMRSGLIPLSQQLGALSSLSITLGDVYQRLAREAEEHFDLIIIDVDHSPEDQLAKADHGFYSIQRLSRAKLHLRPGGVLAVWSYAEDGAFADAMRESFSRVLVEPVRTMNTLVGHEQTDWLFFGKVE